MFEDILLLSLFLKEDILFLSDTNDLFNVSMTLWIESAFEAL